MRFTDSPSMSPQAETEARLPVPHSPTMPPLMPPGTRASGGDGDHLYVSNHPRALGVLNSLGRAVGITRRRRFRIDAERLMHGAERSTGLSDWGSDDFLPPLARLVEALNEEAALTPVGRAVCTRSLQSALETRLLVQQELNRHPGILDQQIRRPLFIIGLPRTGSTLLQRLLCQDPAVHHLKAFETMFPTPSRAGSSTDDRIRRAERRLRLYNWMVPDLASVHAIEATEPEECTLLLQNTFLNVSFGGMAQIPSYVGWVLQQDMASAYRYYETQLKLLQWRRPGDHWVLKSPIHLFALRPLMEIFPDANVIQTHREPARVLPSYCSLAQMRRSLASDNVDPRLLGRNTLEVFAGAAAKAIETRREIGDERFFDVAYRDLLGDPFPVIRRIYERFSYELTPEAESAMRRWYAAHPQHKHGVHRYTPEQFGLTPERINERLSPVIERFREYM